MNNNFNTNQNNYMDLPALHTLEGCILPTQEELFAALLEKYGDRAIACRDQFILVPGEAPVLLLAHLDTVHEERVREIIREEDRLSSPQGIGGDDRCGVYAITKVYDLAAVKPWLLYTCNEEIGCVGARHFAALYDCAAFPKRIMDGLAGVKCLIEIDRKGSNDAVYYDCFNPAFEDYISGKGFVTEWGSSSDIKQIGPVMNRASVNLSSGYYNAHRLYEYIIPSQVENTIRRVLEIVADSLSSDFPVYVHQGRDDPEDLDGWGDWYPYGA